MPEDTKSAPTITFTDPKTGKDRTILMKVGSNSSPEMLDKYVEEYLNKHPEPQKDEGTEREGTAFSSKKGSLKTAPVASPGMSMLEKIAPYLPFGGAIDRVTAAGERATPETPGWRQSLGGAEDVAETGFDLMGMPTLIRGGLKGLLPAGKAVAGYEVGSKAAGKVADMTNASPEVSRAASIVAGAAGGGITQSPKTLPTIKSGVSELVKGPSIRRASIPFGLGYAAGHHVGGYEGGLVGGTAAAALPSLVKGMQEAPTEHLPLIDPALTQSFKAPPTIINPEPAPSVNELNQQRSYGFANRNAQRAIPAQTQFNMPGSVDPYAQYPPGTAPENAGPVMPPSALPTGQPRLELPAPYATYSAGAPETGFEHFSPPQAPTVVDTTPLGLPPGLGNRSGQAIPMPPAERIPGTGKFSPKGTREVRKAFYEPRTVDAKSEVVEEKPTAVAQPSPKEDVKPETKPESTTKPVSKIQETIKKTNENLKSRKTEKVKPTNSKSEGTQAEETKAPESLPENKTVTEPIKAPEPNSITTPEATGATINPAIDQMLGQHEPSWQPGRQISMAHLYKTSDALGLKYIAPLARLLMEEGYDVEQGKFGYGLKSGKKDIGILEKLKQNLSKIPEE